MTNDSVNGPAQPGFLASAAFWLMLVTVALAPIPFGSNRPWAWSLLSLVVGGLILLWAIAAFQIGRAHV